MQTKQRGAIKMSFKYARQASEAPAIKTTTLKCVGKEKILPLWCKLMRWVTHDIVPIRCFEHCAYHCNFNYLDGKRRRMANKLACRLAVVKLRWGFSCHICIKNGKEKDVPQLSKMCNIRLMSLFSKSFVRLVHFSGLRWCYAIP